MPSKTENALSLYVEPQEFQWPVSDSPMRTPSIAPVCLPWAE